MVFLFPATWREGYETAAHGDSKAQCPYDWYSLRSLFWHDGWCAGMNWKLEQPITPIQSD